MKALSHQGPHVLVACLIFLGSTVRVRGEEWILTRNPYEQVDWESFGQHPSNLHTHTTESDGRHAPHEVIDAYHKLGYGILAITDHNHVTWRWEDYGRDPKELLMIAVVGNELSRHHHANSLFTEYPKPIREHSTGDLDTSLREVEELDGLIFLCHPGRYWNTVEGRVPDEVLQRYLRLFAEHRNLIGLEIHNQNDRYPDDRLLWDALLNALMPRRTVLAFANDDTHQPNHVGLNANVFVLRELTLEHTRLAMRRGQFYPTTITTQPDGQRDRDKTPKITRVVYNREAGTVILHAEAGGEALPDEAYTWISAGGTRVHQGPALDLNGTEGLGNYIRAEIRGPGGTAYTQAFGIRRRGNN